MSGRPERRPKSRRARGLGTGWLVSLVLHAAALLAARQWITSVTSSRVESEREVVAVLDLRTLGLTPPEPRVVEPRGEQRDAIPRSEPPALESPEATPLDAEVLFAAEETTLPPTNVIVAAPAGVPGSGVSFRPIGVPRRAPALVEVASGAGTAPGNGAGAGAEAGTEPASGTPDGTTDVLLPPEIVFAPSIPYPPESRRRSEEGETRCRIHVTAEGSVSEVEVTTSSGHERLDAAARTGLLAWRFRPATRGGVPCACVVEHVVAFRLVSAAAAAR